MNRIDPGRRALCGALRNGVAAIATFRLVGFVGTARASEAARPEFMLVNRLSWGADAREMDRIQRLSRKGYIEAQLHPAADARLPPNVQSSIDALELNRKPAIEWMQEVREARREERRSKRTQDNGERKALNEQLKALGHDAAVQSLLRAVHSPNGLQEQLTWFWFNHFNVFQHKRQIGALLGDYEQSLRKLALGRFSDLLIASATHPAMLQYLDNDRNVAGKLNENYARELMELHTLGVDGGYSQKDVQELARVLTGLGVPHGPEGREDDRPKRFAKGGGARAQRNMAVGAAEFHSAHHDTDTKVLLGQNVGGQGWDEILAQLMRLARHPSTARHVCTRLATFFVSDQPPASLLNQMIERFQRSDGDITQTLQRLFSAAEFEASLGGKFKDPVHYVVSGVRATLDPTMVAPADDMIRWLTPLEQGLFNRTTPDGYPLSADAWSGAAQMRARFDVATQIARDGSVERAAALFNPSLGPKSRAAIDATANPRARLAMLLSAPEIMFR